MNGELGNVVYGKGHNNINIEVQLLTGHTLDIAVNAKVCRRNSTFFRL